MTSIGMNLNPVNYWSTQFPFIDRFKTSGNWSSQGVPAGQSTTVAVDANGYPTGLPTGASNIYTMVALDPVSEPMTDVYVLTYKGEATFRPVGATIISSEPGKIVFQYTDTSSIMMPLSITKMNASNPVSDIHIVRQDQVDLFNEGEIFNPDFISKTENWDTIRYMDWEKTNNSTLTSWSQRNTVDSASWAGSTDNGSVPIEVMVALANETKTNMWLNIPAQADDDFVRKMMEYVRDNLDPSLKVDLEYSNEVWNFGFSQAKYAQAQADALWGTDKDGDGVNDAGSVGRGNFIYYGYRAAQVANIANSVFGASADTRLNTVLSTQTAYTGGESFIFQGVAKAGLGSVSSLFDSYAITTYFGGLGGTSAKDQATILGWARSGEAGMAAAFQALLTGEGLDSNNSIANTLKVAAYQAGVAAQNGLDLVSYEGGAEFVTEKFPADQQPEIADFFARLKADPRMGDLTKALVDGFADADGTLINIFHDTQAYKAAGDWGTLPSIYGTSPTYEALVAMAQATQDTGLARTDAASYAFAAGQTEVMYTGTAAFTASGNALANKIIGSSSRQNRIDGGAGNDILIGGTGNDSLNGGAGADTMMGGLGNDIYVVDNINDFVGETLGAGIDEIQTSLTSYTLVANVENLTFTGTAAFTGIGNALDNVIRGGSGNDTLNGAGGADTLMGGAGNDIYIVDDARVVVVEAADNGTDTVRTSVGSYRLGGGIENLIFTGQGNFRGDGNELANTITGGAGDDTIDGGAGADRMVGGLGNDVYYVDNASDKVIEDANGGIDTVITTLATYTLAANVENGRFAGQGVWRGVGNALDNLLVGGDGGNTLIGNEGNDTLIGGAGNDTLRGGTGTDLMIGGKGDDVYYVDDVSAQVVELADQGKDTVYSSVSLTLGANIETLRLTGAANLDGTGNELDNGLNGNDGANRLYGLDGNDNLYGLGGDDTLDGGAGDDVLTGGAGNDVLIGADGADTLLGGDGNDTLYGGAGKDVLQGQAGADLYVFAPGDLGTTRETTDMIWGFSSAEGDRIDLSAFDALLTDGTKQTFIGTAAFSGKAGEIRIRSFGGYLDVTGDLNGDGEADYSLTVSSATKTLTVTDFVL